MKVLLAVDGSKFSEAAKKFVIEQARPGHTEITVLHVVEPPSLLVSREMAGLDRNLDAAFNAEAQQAEALVAKIAEELRSKSLKVTTVVERATQDPRLLKSHRNAMPT